MASDRLKAFIQSAAFALAYLLAAQLGDILTLKPHNFTTFWIPSGLYLGVLLRASPQRWPLLVAAGVMGNLAFDLGDGKPLWVALFFSAGNSLEALVGAVLIRRWLSTRPALETFRQVIWVSLFGALIAPTVSASIGSLVVIKAFGANSFLDTWFVWWSADMMGVLLVAPMVLTWTRDGLRRYLTEEPWRVVETGLVLGGLGLFYGLAISVPGDLLLYHKNLILLPLLVVAFRLGLIGVALVNVILALLVAWTIASDGGDFLFPPGSTSVLAIRLNLFLGLIAFTTLAVAAVLAERRAAQAALQASEERFRVLFENSLDAVFLTTPQGGILEANPAACRMYGYTVEEFRRLGRGPLMDPEDSRLKDALTERERTGRFQGELSQLRQDGTKFFGEVSSFVYADSQGRQVTSTIVRDVTRRKRNEEALRASLVEKDALLQEIHHRVKNNLAVVISLLNLQAKGVQDPQQKNFLADVQGRIRAMALIHESLYGAPSLSSIDLKAYVGELVRHLRGVYGEREEKAEIRIEIGEVRLGLDQGVSVGLILNELLTNALKHGRPRMIKIRTELSGNNLLRLSVANDGHGLSPEFSLDEKRGLGLWLIKSLTEYQLKGQLVVVSREPVEFALTFEIKGS